MTEFVCPRCQMIWGFPDLSLEQAQTERRHICPRCNTIGEVAQKVALSFMGKIAFLLGG